MKKGRAPTRNLRIANPLLPLSEPLRSGRLFEMKSKRMRMKLTLTTKSLHLWRIDHLAKRMGKHSEPKDEV